MYGTRFKSFRYLSSSSLSRRNFSSQPNSLGKFFEQQLTKLEHRDAFHSKEDKMRITFKELHINAVALGNGLHEFDFKPGSAFLSTLPNGPNQITIQLGTALAGVQNIVTQPDPSLSQLDLLLQHTQTRGVVLNHAVFTPKIINQFFPETENLIPGPPFRSYTYRALKHVFHDGVTYVSGTNQFHTLFTFGLYHSHIPDIEKQLKPSDPIVRQVYLKDDKIVQESSFTHEKILNIAHSIRDKLQLTWDDRVCLGFPLYSNKGHAIGTWSCISSGSFMAFPSTLKPKHIIDTVEKDYCNVLFTSPEIFEENFQSETPLLSRIKKVLLSKFFLFDVFLIFF